MIIFLVKKKGYQDDELILQGILKGDPTISDIEKLLRSNLIQLN